LSPSHNVLGTVRKCPVVFVGPPLLTSGYVYGPDDSLRRDSARAGKVDLSAVSRQHIHSGSQYVCLIKCRRCINSVRLFQKESPGLAARAYYIYVSRSILRPIQKTYTYVNTYIHVHIYICTYTYVYIYMNIHIQVYVFLSIYVHTYIYIHTHMNKQIYQGRKLPA